MGPGPSRPARRAAAGLVALLLAAHLATVPWPAAEPDRARTPPPLRLDPNFASAAELDLLPGLGPQLSAAIVSYRADCGRTPAFACVDDLSAIRGIGPKLVEALRPSLRFAPAPGAP